MWVEGGGCWDAFLASSHSCWRILPIPMFSWGGMKDT